jgi:hypothetical protein
MHWRAAYGSTDIDCSHTYAAFPHASSAVRLRTTQWFFAATFDTLREKIHELARKASRFGNAA